MPLKEQVAADLLEAMRARDPVRTGALRLLRAAIQSYEVARTDKKHPRFGEEITETDLISVVDKEIRQRTESIDAYTRGGRSDLAEHESREIEILRPYLPDRMSREAIAAHVSTLIAETGRDFRAVMPRAAKELRGRGDGALINAVVKELTSG